MIFNLLIVFCALLQVTAGISVGSAKVSWFMDILQIYRLNSGFEFRLVLR